MRHFSVLLLCLPCLVGCVFPQSKHPLSDEKNSIEEARLVGKWLMIAPRQEGEPVPAGDANEFIEFRRSAGKSSVYVAQSRNEPEQKSRIVCTRIKDQSYFSAREDKEPPTEAAPYLLMHYEFKGDDEIHWYMLDPERVIKAIKNKQIAGVVEYNDPGKQDDPNKPPSAKKIVITATTDELRAMIEKSGPVLFHTEETALILKRDKK